MKNKFKTVVVTKADLQYQYNSTIMELLPHLFNRDYNSDIKNNDHVFREKTVSLKYKAIDWHIEGKMKEEGLKKFEIAFEACQDKEHFLSILVTQKSTEGRRSKNLCFFQCWYPVVYLLPPYLDIKFISINCTKAWVTVFVKRDMYKSKSASNWILWKLK